MKLTSHAGTLLKCLRLPVLAAGLAACGTLYASDKTISGNYTVAAGGESYDNVTVTATATISGGPLAIADGGTIAVSAGTASFTCPVTMGTSSSGTVTIAPAADKSAEAQYWDRSVADFPALAGETDDAPRLQRAVDASANKVLFVPAGDYRLAQTLVITNFCSVLMHKGARFLAEKPMDFVVRVNFSPVFKARDILDFGTFFKGGRIDGRGIASCMSIHGYIHFTLRDVCFHNGKLYGLRVKGDPGPGGAELNAFNLHFVNKMKGNAGNAAVRVSGCDDNFTDCWSMDYTIGFDIEGGSNFFTRCHAWGGVIGAPAPGEMPEYLKDSIGFKIRKNSGNVLLRDCYADTSTIGFLNEGWEVRILGCCFFYNTGCIRHVKPEKLDKMVIFKQPGGSMLVADCMVSKHPKDMKIYEGTGNARFRDIIYCGKAYEPGEVKPGACVFKMDVPHDVKLAN